MPETKKTTDPSVDVTQLLNAIAQEQDPTKRAAKANEIAGKINTDVHNLIGKTLEEQKAETAKEAQDAAEKAAEKPKDTAADAQTRDTAAPAQEFTAPGIRALVQPPDAAVNAEQESDHPAAMTGNKKIASMTAIGGVSLAAAAAANSVPYLPAFLQTNDLALGAYTGMQSLVPNLPLIGSWIPVAGGALSTIGATAILAPALTGGLYALGKVSNLAMRGAYGMLGWKHENTGLGLRKNLWYGVKAATSPIWGAWEALKWTGNKAITHIPWLATAAGRRSAHELRNAVKWGGVTGLGIAALWLMAAVSSPPGAIIIAGSVVGGLGIGYGGNLLYRGLRRFVGQEPSTLPPAASNGTKNGISQAHETTPAAQGHDAPQAGHAEPAHHMAA